MGGKKYERIEFNRKRFQEVVNKLAFEIHECYVTKDKERLREALRKELGYELTYYINKYKTGVVAFVSNFGYKVRVTRNKNYRDWNERNQWVITVTNKTGVL